MHRESRSTTTTRRATISRNLNTSAGIYQSSEEAKSQLGHQDARRNSHAAAKAAQNASFCASAACAIFFFESIILRIFKVRKNTQLCHTSRMDSFQFRLNNFSTIFFAIMRFALLNKLLMQVRSRCFLSTLWGPSP